MPYRVLSHSFRFFENAKNFPIFENIIFGDHFSKISKIFKVLTFQDSSLIESFTLNLLLKTNRYYLLNCLRDSFSRKPLFLP